MSIKLLINLAIPNFMSIISSNIKFLRKKKGLTQQNFADQVGIKRSLVGAYEEERAEPKYDFIKETINEKWVSPAPKGNLRILSISVDKEDNENIEMVPLKASAGYLNGYADVEYVAKLPKLYLPMFKQGTYRGFEINGDSMLPLVSGTVIIGEYVENWSDVKGGDTYVVISKSDGVVYKRIGGKFKENKKLKLISDNPVYEPYEINAEDVLEIWKAKAYISTHMPMPTPEPTMESLTSMMTQMQRSIANLSPPTP
jgi:transcriptional regulator with XRE-family HTH domain